MSTENTSARMLCRLAFRLRFSYVFLSTLPLFVACIQRSTYLVCTLKTCNERVSIVTKFVEGAFLTHLFPCIQSTVTSRQHGHVPNFSMYNSALHLHCHYLHCHCHHPYKELQPCRPTSGENEASGRTACAQMRDAATTNWHYYDRLYVRTDIPRRPRLVR